jgi:hypothetical protein
MLISILAWCRGLPPQFFMKYLICSQLASAATLLWADSRFYRRLVVGAWVLAAGFVAAGTAASSPRSKKAGGGANLVTRVTWRDSTVAQRPLLCSAARKTSFCRTQALWAALACSGLALVAAPPQELESVPLVEAARDAAVLGAVVAAVLYLDLSLALSPVEDGMFARPRFVWAIWAATGISSPALRLAGSATEPWVRFAGLSAVWALVAAVSGGAVVHVFRQVLAYSGRFGGRVGGQRPAAGSRCPTPTPPPSSPGPSARVSAVSLRTSESEVCWAVSPSGNLAVALPAKPTLSTSTSPVSETRAASLRKAESRLGRLDGGGGGGGATPSFRQRASRKRRAWMNDRRKAWKEDRVVRRLAALRFLACTWPLIAWPVCRAASALPSSSEWVWASEACVGLCSLFGAVSVFRSRAKTRTRKRRAVKIRIKVKNVTVSAPPSFSPSRVPAMSVNAR